MKLERHAHLNYWRSEAPENNRPLVLFFHGSGERGSDPEAVLRWGLPKSVYAIGQCPFHLIAPQCPANMEWTDILPECMKLVMQWIEKLATGVPIIGAGFSMGGQGILEIAATNPTLFQSILAVAPRNTRALRNLGYDKFGSTNVLLIHGENDPVVPLEYSQTIAAEIESHHGNVRLEILASEGHFIADEVFSIPNFQKLLEEHLLS